MLSDFLLVKLQVVWVRVRGGDDKPDVPRNSERKPLKAGLGPCNAASSGNVGAYWRRRVWVSIPLSHYSANQAADIARKLGGYNKRNSFVECADCGLLRPKRKSFLR